MTAYWKTLSHNGVHFPPPYEPLGMSVKVSGRPVPLSSLAEEMAYLFARKKDTPYVQDPVFTSNFADDFVRQLPPWCKGAKYNDMDFSEFYRRVDQEKAAKESMSKEQKKALAASRKEQREALKARFGKAVLDGKEVDIANWMVEPPGLFMGRGKHPFRGKWKPRVGPSDVVLNLGETAPVPPGAWKEIVHDHDSMWMAKWIDRLTEKEKYVWLHESAPIQQSRSKAKYDNARKVGTNLERIRAKIMRELDSKDEKMRQVATVCYLIDTMGMRVGDEKEEDEADTVGASTLRVEHVNLKGEVARFDFLGKDSVSWAKSEEVPPSVARNLGEFMSGKKPQEEIFHDVNSGMVNQFLSSIVPGVSAKVFRTHHATATAKGALGSKDMKSADDLDKLYHAKEANLQAAIFCNHQRTPPKTWEESLRKKQEKLEAARAKGDEKRIAKLQREVDFYVRTKNYNLNTSMKNYIDPRVYKSWCDYVGLDWAKVYSKSLQRKFSWVLQSSAKWEQESDGLRPVAAARRSSEHSP
ncbi:MAG: DNA topoisomerase I [Nitrososphaerota archaeon]|nr:DNA topoisomerase I [Nitrososphaerota archaeon]MDG7024723.1 DNA topoisomerase I [Nitrososphaerota archaeon]